MVLVLPVSGNVWRKVPGQRTATAGVAEPRAVWMAFVMSTAMAGLAGSLFAHFEAFISPFDFNLEMSLFILALAVCGGLGSLEWGYPWGRIARRDLRIRADPQYLSTLDLRACLSPRGFGFPHGLLTVFRGRDARPDPRSVGNQPIRHLLTEG